MTLGKFLILLQNFRNFSICCSTCILDFFDAGQKGVMASCEMFPWAPLANPSKRGRFWAELWWAHQTEELLVFEIIQLLTFLTNFGPEACLSLPRGKELKFLFKRLSCLGKSWWFNFYSLRAAHEDLIRTEGEGINTHRNPNIENCVIWDQWTWKQWISLGFVCISI